ncbi:GNAT family N-acetyltransferase [Thalassotalea ganghwensis]
MKVIDSFNHQHIEQLHQLYQQVWWANERTLAETKAGVEGSQLCIGIVDENHQLVAFTRVLTDFIYKAILFDVIVCSKHRGAGLGKNLMDAIQVHPRLSQVKHIELYCLPEVENFYKNYGFSSEVGGVNLMRKNNVL